MGTRLLNKDFFFFNYLFSRHFDRNTAFFKLLTSKLASDPIQKSVEPVRPPHANQISSYDFLTNFGKPGSGAPYKNSKRTLMLNERFDNKVKDHHWIQSK